jgi:hypothetical protein
MIAVPSIDPLVSDRAIVARRVILEMLGRESRVAQVCTENLVYTAGSVGRTSRDG